MLKTLASISLKSTTIKSHVAMAASSASAPSAEKRPAEASKDTPAKFARGQVKVLDREAFFERSRAARLRTNPDSQLIFAMYSSLIDGIVTDPELMVIPFDDHAVLRGHAVFDTATLSKGCIYRLGIHLDRLFASARAARLKLPFGESEDENRQRMIDIASQTCVASGRRDGMVRYFLTAGPGNFGFTSAGCEPAFYCVVFGGMPTMVSKAICETTVRLSTVPMKPPLLAQIKSNNYMLNCMTAMEAQSKGGSFGILVHDNDTIAEAAVLNCVVVTEQGELITPPFDGILAGTTVRKAMELARRHLLGDGGLLTEVRQEVLELATLRAAKEVFLTGGDTHVFPIKMLDGQQIGDGNAPGPVAAKILKLLEQDADKGFGEEHIVLEYSKF